MPPCVYLYSLRLVQFQMHQPPHGLLSNGASLPPPTRVEKNGSLAPGTMTIFWCAWVVGWMINLIYPVLGRKTVVICFHAINSPNSLILLKCGIVLNITEIQRLFKWPLSFDPQSSGKCFTHFTSHVFTLDFLVLSFSSKDAGFSDELYMEKNGNEVKEISSMVGIRLLINTPEISSKMLPFSFIKNTYFF